MVVTFLRLWISLEYSYVRVISLETVSAERQYVGDFLLHNYIQL